MPAVILIFLLLAVVSALNSTENTTLLTGNSTINKTLPSSTTSPYVMSPPKLSAGSLESSLIDPSGDANVTQNNFFNFTSRVECVGGFCGNITATLDPRKYRKIAERRYPVMHETVDGFTLRYVFEEPVVGKHGVFESVTVSGTHRYGAPGYPVLPFKTARILIPHGEKIVDVEVAAGQEIAVGKGFKVEPGQKPISLCSKDPVEFTPPDEKVYSSHNEFPQDLFSKDYRVQEKRGYSILIVNLFPVRYVPATGRLSYFRDLTLTVKTRKAGRAKKPGNFRGLPGDRRVLEGIADNPSTLKSYDGIGREKLGGSPQSTSFVNSSESYDYVIITSAALNASSRNYTFHDLVDHKNSRGVKSRIVTVKQIMAEDDYDCDGSIPTSWGDGCGTGSQFNDTQAHIRNFIRDAYQNWGIQYVLLGGDADGANVSGESGDNIVPARGFYAQCVGSDSNLISDLYYSGLNGSWNNDNDSYWGEDGEDDIYAEVYVGRAPVDSDSEVSNFVKKTIAYENSNDAYLEKALMVGEHLGFGGASEYGKDSKEEIRNGSNAHGYNTTGFPDNYNVSTLYDADWEKYGWPKPYRGSGGWPKSTLISFMNNGTHIINHLGHASTLYVMKLCNAPVYQSEPYCGTSGDTDIDDLINDKYFFAYSQGCYPGAFDNWNYEGVYTKSDSIAEHLVTSEHGAFAVIMNSRYGWGAYNSTNGASQHPDREFFNALFGEDKRHLGEANHYSKEASIGFLPDPCIRWVIYETNLLGDPETSIKIPGEDKGVIPVNDSYAKPFYTISNNPYNADNLACLKNMNANDSCNQTWIVNATGDSGSWEFFVIYESDNSTVNTNISKKINITIIDASPPQISDIKNTSITYHSARITWKTDDYSNSTVYYGTTPSNLSSVNWTTSFEKEHEVSIEGLDSLTLYYYNVSSCNMDGCCSESGPYNFSTTPMPIQFNGFACHNGSEWLNCSSIAYGDTLAQVRVNCSSKDGQILAANITLMNIPDSRVFFTGTNATEIGGYWTYNNPNESIEDSGTWNLSAVCRDNLSQVGQGEFHWDVPWGNITGYMINPISNKNVIQYGLFNFTSGVNCSGGECGNISASLYTLESDQTNYSIETTTYNWIEINNGSDSGITGDDDCVTLNLGFNFTFFNNTYSNITVSSNGYITFGGYGWRYSNADIPNSLEPNDYIAPFWDDLDPSEGGKIYYKTQGSSPTRKFIVEWWELPHYTRYGGYDNITFEAILYEGSDRIKFQYDDVVFGYIGYDNGKNATVGLENYEGTDGAKFSYMSDLLSDGMTLLFEKGKHLIPENTGNPFYTTSENPGSCPDMGARDSCNITWHVNATGSINTSKMFHVSYDPVDYGSYLSFDTTDPVNVTITGDLPPDITSHSITPKVALNGSDVTIEMNASDSNLDRMWCSITMPNSTNTTLNLSSVSYSPPLTGRYNITFYANDSAGNENSVDDHFIVKPGLLFNSSSVDYNDSGLSTNLSFYYEGSLILFNKSDEGNFSLWIPDYVYDMGFSTFNGSFTALLREVNFSQNNNKSMNFDRKTIPDYLATYAAEGSYNFIEATLTLSYEDTGYGDETHLGIYICHNWSIPQRKCLEDWVNATGNASQDEDEDTFTLNVSGFSGFSIKQEPYCGDGIKNDGEECDKKDFGGKTCSTYGYNRGLLSCTLSCTINSGGCYNSGGGSGNGGGSGGGFSAIAITKATCFDGLKNCHDNACEEEVDCGGPCEPCPSCTDNIQNQGENGVDCGGPCKPCITTTTSTTTLKATTSSTLAATTTLQPPTTTVSETTLTSTTTPIKKDYITGIAGILLVITVIAIMVIGRQMIHTMTTKTTKEKKQEEHMSENETDANLKTIGENIDKIKSDDLGEEEHDKILRETYDLYKDVKEYDDQ